MLQQNKEGTDCHFTLSCKDTWSLAANQRFLVRSSVDSCLAHWSLLESHECLYGGGGGVIYLRFPRCNIDLPYSTAVFCCGRLIRQYLPSRRRGSDRLAFDRSPLLLSFEGRSLDVPSSLRRFINVVARRGTTAFPNTAKELLAPVPAH